MYFWKWNPNGICEKELIIYSKCIKILFCLVTKSHQLFVIWGATSASPVLYYLGDLLKIY